MKKLFAVLVSLVVAAPLAAQQTSYYIIDGDSNTGYVVRDGTLQFTFSVSHQSDFASYGLRFDQGNFLVVNRNGTASREYNPFGVFTGVSNNLGPQNLDQLLDGGTDGTSTYTARYGNNTGVYKGDMNFGNQSLLFSLGDTYGVTYGNGYVWAITENTMFQYTTGGAFVNSFGLGLDGDRAAALAYESSTNSLWFGANGTGDLYNYGLDGTQLARITVEGLGGNYWAGEMMNVAGTSVVPEPSTYALMTAGLLGLGVASRRRRRKA